jgi:formylglycine-generating enzyme required for sulfatase activity
MAEQVRVFVSHHHSPDEDRFTAQLVRDLQAAGADVWVDDQGITSDDFVQKISEGLAGRQWLVLVMTPAALASPWVRREVNAALNEQTANRMQGVLPLVLQSCAEQEIPMLWRPLHRYDATQDASATIARLLGALGLAARGEQLPQPEASLAMATTALPDSPRPLLRSLHNLGYSARKIAGVEVILPPLCPVPAGPFTMGSDKTRDPHAQDAETPQYVIAVGAYQIAAYPVTVAEYACAVRAKAVPEPSKGTWRPIKWKGQLQQLYHPVVCVSWRDATAYAAWLAKVTGQPWQLPSEAEWEKAARSTDGRIYPWGNQWNKARANTTDGGPGATTPVGAYAELGDASPYGVHDLAGNVWEWTSSLFKPYSDMTSGGREDPNFTAKRVLRGGSWEVGPRDARAACRGEIDPGRFYGDLVSVIAFDDIGFRLVVAAAGSA